MTVDLVCLAVLAFAAIAGASSGALRQTVQLSAVVVGWLAARHLGPAVALGLAGHLPALIARAAASVLLFAGAAVLAGWTGHALLRAGGVARAVRSPADRGLGALLGAAKAALAIWVLLSALALAGGRVRAGGLRVDARGSEFAAVARGHNLLVRFDPDAARMLERILRAARDPREEARMARDPDLRRLLGDARVRSLLERHGKGTDGEVDAGTEAQRLLEDDPELHALVQRLNTRGNSAR